MFQEMKPLKVIIEIKILMITLKMLMCSFKFYHCGRPFNHQKVTNLLADLHVKVVVGLCFLRGFVGKQSL